MMWRWNFAVWYWEKVRLSTFDRLRSEHKFFEGTWGERRGACWRDKNARTRLSQVTLLVEPNMQKLSGTHHEVKVLKFEKMQTGGCYLMNVK